MNIKDLINDLKEEVGEENVLNVITVMQQLYLDQTQEQLLKDKLDCLLFLAQIEHLKKFGCPLYKYEMIKENGKVNVFEYNMRAYLSIGENVKGYLREVSVTNKEFVRTFLNEYAKYAQWYLMKMIEETTGWTRTKEREIIHLDLLKYDAELSLEMENILESDFD